MENENNENIDSINDEEMFEENNESSDDDIDTLKAKLLEVENKNRQLFSRTKKAEGFELKDGKWVKPEAPKEQEKPEVETKTPKEPSQPNELDYGQLALLRTEGIKGSGEIALFKEVMKETGKEVLDVLDSNYFKSRLSDFRQAQESANAVPKGKNRSGQTGVTDVDMAMAKYKETGELPSDFKTRSAVVKALEAEEQSSGMFQGPAVVGPNR